MEITIRALITDDLTIVPVKHIESMNFEQNDEEKLVSVLSGKLMCHIITMSGLSYDVDCMVTIGALGEYAPNFNNDGEVKQFVLDCWFEAIGQG